MKQTTQSRQFSIREMSREFGVTARTLRFYEDKGLVSPVRKGQTRLFSNRDRGRVRMVLQGKRVGFTLDEIKELLDLYELGDAQVPQMKEAVKKFKERIAQLEERRREIDKTIADLTRSCDVVAGMLKEREA